MTYRQSIRVPFSYDVIYTRDAFAPSNEVLADVLADGSGRFVAYLDDGLRPGWSDLDRRITAWAEAHADLVTLAADPEWVPGGEAAKQDLAILDRIGESAARLGLCRHSYVVIVGGGAILDAVGFAAATVHRGLRQVRMPTTVLAQDDSGVGVKNGLNRFGIKNFYGSFAPPAAVISDVEFLRTLDRRDWVSGVAEAFKVAIIKDIDFLEQLEELAGDIAGRDLDAMARVVRRSAEIHLDHIASSGDAFEAGSARPLDFGHWAAHRLEEMTGNTLRHGEAVAIGIAIDLHAAGTLGLIEEPAIERVLGAMERCGMRLWDDALERRDGDGRLEVVVGLEEFRQHLGGELTLAMPNPLGAQTNINALEDETIVGAIAYLGARARGPGATAPPEQAPMLPSSRP